MTKSITSRRLFVQLAGSAALLLRHGLRTAEAGASGAGASTAGAAATSSAAAASLGDSAILVEWDDALRMRVSRTGAAGSAPRPVTDWSVSDYVLGATRHIDRFRLQHHSRTTIATAHGPGTRLTLTSVSADGLEQTLEATLYARYPGFMLTRVTYRNTSQTPLALLGWSTRDVVLNETADAAAPEYWSYSGATYSNRRDWVQPVKRHFEQDNYLGMESADYGGGTPIVDVWHRAGGIAVGHVETVPRLVSIPLQELGQKIRLAISARDKRALAPGATLETVESFLTVHSGDYFATLTAYRKLMGERGVVAATPPATSYEPDWCAWGYERNCTTQLILDTLPKVHELGLAVATIDDGWQAKIGDWRPHPVKYPHGDADIRDLVAQMRAHDLKARLWFSPLSVAPGSDALHDQSDMLLLDKDGAPQPITWWNSFYLCPAYAKTVEHTQGLVKKFIGDWGFAGLKIDGQHLNGVAPCYNPAHNHARPEESVEGLQNFYKAMYETAMAANSEAVMEVCPCGTSYSMFNFPYMNQAPASDPESSWQVRLKGKTLKGLMGPSAPYAGDHVELSDHGDDFASTVGVGAIISTKFTWPVDPKPKDSFLLTPEREIEWRKWIAIYNDKRLAQGTYRGELYDIAFDKPETHAIEKSGRLYYAFYAKSWQGEVTLRGLADRPYRVRDYYNDRDVATLGAANQPGSRKLTVAFERFLVLEAIPV